MPAQVTLYYVGRCPECRRMTLRHALFTQWLPESCGYVRRYRIRRPA